MDGVTLLLAAAAVSALYMAWNIGANDVANAMGTSVGSGALSLREAILVAAIFELGGAVLFGASVTETIADGIVRLPALDVDSQLVATGLTGCLISAAAWLHFATQRGWPVSTTHAIVGAVLGFGLVIGGVDAVEWSLVGAIGLGWVLAPLLGGVSAWLLFRLIHRTILEGDRPERAILRLGPLAVALVIGLPIFAVLVDPRPPLAFAFPWETAAVVAGGGALLAALVVRVGLARQIRRSEGPERPAQQLFVGLQVATACFIAFAHGSNDVANAVGPLAAIFAAMAGELHDAVPIPMNVLLIGAFGIVLGLATFGFRVMATIGRRITELTAAHGFAAELATALTVFFASELGLPVSTTQVLVGAVIGVGLSRSIGALDMSVLREVLLGWVSTVPVTATLAGALAYLASRFF